MQFASNFIQLITFFNLFPLEVVQKMPTLPTLCITGKLFSANPQHEGKVTMYIKSRMCKQPSRLRELQKDRFAIFPSYMCAIFNGARTIGMILRCIRFTDIGSDSV